MDSMISAAARALAVGDALGALQRVSLRNDPPALALRGIAMAQLGEYPRARDLLRRAARAFGAREALARARCVLAEAEVLLAMRELGGPTRTLATAAATLEANGDQANALHARLIAARRLLLLGHLDEAATVLARAGPAFMDHRQSMRGRNAVPPALEAVAELLAAELALRSLRIQPAKAALARAQEAATRARIPALRAEVREAQTALERPAARHITHDQETSLRLEDVAALIASSALIVDGCRRGLRAGSMWVPLARRPLLFTLAWALAQRWPGDVDRQTLIADAFRIRRPDETHRARLRVEMGRLRALLAGMAGIAATTEGFRLVPRGARDVIVLAPPIDGDEASLVALLSDGAAWSSSALAMALGASQRTVQRALVDLEAAQRVRSIGRARARRWLLPPLAGFTTILLLPATLTP
jgi:hypothetical protein